MISVEFYIKDNDVVGFKIHGHAEYDDHGYDIVCASCSAVVQMSANAITDYYKAAADVKVFDNEVQLKLKEDDDRSQLLLKCLKNELTMLSEDFGSFIKITSTEV